MNTSLIRCTLVAALGALGAAGCHSDEVMVTKSPNTVSLGTSTPEQRSRQHIVMVNELVNPLYVEDSISSACGLATPHFAFDSSKVQVAANEDLDKVVECLTTGPLAGRSIKLVGHTDPRGNPDYNAVLGQRRADQVANYIADRGVRVDKIAMESRGALDAVGTNPQSWADDRRVDIRLAD